MKVIDVSAWQENVDWEAVKAAGIEGVVIKLGESDRIDDRFVQHVNDAVAYGFQYGVYYYARAATPETAREEAAQVAAWLKEYLRGENPALGIWYDAEDGVMLSGDVTAVCSAFVSALNAIGYVYVGIYSSYNWLANGVIATDQLAAYVPYWVAQYDAENSFQKEHPDKIVRMWQFTDRFSEELPYDCSVYYK